MPHQNYWLFLQPLRKQLLTVYIRVKLQVDLQADKSYIVVKGPFFPSLMNPRYRIRAQFGAPFALGVRLFIASSSVRRHIEQIILPTPFTRKPLP
jgi:hypothetical protein